MFIFAARRLDEYLISVLLALGAVALLAGNARGDYRVVNHTEGALRVAVFEPEDVGRLYGSGWQTIAAGESAVVSSCARPVIGILVQDDETGMAFTPPDAIETVEKPACVFEAFTVLEGVEPLGLIRLTWGMPPTIELIRPDWSSGDLPTGWYAADVSIVPSDGTFEVSTTTETETEAESTSHPDESP